MTHERMTKYIAIGLLLVTVLGLSIGFAVFSKDLRIAPQAIVTPNPAAFKVGFSRVNNALTDGNVTPTINQAANTKSNLLQATASTATIDNSGAISTLSNLQVRFTESGQSVQYRLYIYNAGEYVAYLNSLVFNNAEGAQSPKECIAVDGVSNVSSACNDISVTVQIGNSTFTPSTAVNTLSNHTLNKKTAEEVIITVSYNKTANVSHDFYVKYGDISLVYAT